MQGWQLRSLANWVNASTPLGLLVARLGHARVETAPRGLYVAAGYTLRVPTASAFAVGSVVVTRHERVWLDARPGLMRHEERHTWHYAACGGLPFVPLYVAAMAYSLWRTGDRGVGNVFERLAGLADGGYPTPPTRQAVIGR